MYEIDGEIYWDTYLYYRTFEEGYYWQNINGSLVPKYKYNFDKEEGIGYHYTLTNLTTNEVEEGKVGFKEWNQEELMAKFIKSTQK